ncbi:MAG: acyl carrier protein [Clostridiales bacterium]|jgi:acyl carrier protein|nr:acyl carrier protein [Clostridiales bacterium]
MVLEKIRELIADKIDCEPGTITEETKFSDLGIDSLDVTELVMSIEDEFNIELEIDASMVAVSDLIKAVESKIK